MELARETDLGDSKWHEMAVCVMRECKLQASNSKPHPVSVWGGDRERFLEEVTPELTPKPEYLYHQVKKSGVFQVEGTAHERPGSR